MSAKYAPGARGSTNTYVAIDFLVLSQEKVLDFQHCWYKNKQDGGVRIACREINYKKIKSKTTAQQCNHQLNIYILYQIFKIDFDIW